MSNCGRGKLCGKVLCWMTGTTTTMAIRFIPRRDKKHRVFRFVVSLGALFVLFKLTLSLHNDMAEYLTQNDGWYPPIEAWTGPQPTAPTNRNETTTADNASISQSLLLTTTPPTATTVPIVNAVGPTNTGNVTERPLPPFPWQWIHVTKTGSSFGNVLFALSCPEEIVSLCWKQDDVTRKREKDKRKIPWPDDIRENKDGLTPLFHPLVQSQQPHQTQTYDHNLVNNPTCIDQIKPPFFHPLNSLSSG